MSRARREVGVACALLGLFSTEAVTIASALLRAARSELDVVARNIDFATPKRGALGIPCVGEFKNGRGDFYDQESRSKHPVLFSRATIRLYPHLREGSRARVAQLFIDVWTRE
jgi:hypothetical protein